MPPRKTPVEQVRAATHRADPGATKPYTSNRPSADNSVRRRVVVVGAPEDVPRALQHPAATTGRFDVVAALAIEVDAEQSILNGAALSAVLDLHRPEIILVAGPLGPSTMRRVADLAMLRHCDLLAVMPTEMLAGHNPVVVWSGDSPLVQLARLPRRRWGARAKRFFDVVGAVVGLVVAAPLFAALALAIRLETRGAVLFRHERAGRLGRRFLCLKLRTMSVDAEEVLRSDREMYEEYRRNHYKIPDSEDPRVTVVGRFIRRTSLDELPQLWNVLVGEMSLVGPRPVVEAELENYGSAKDVLLSMRPGITGAWAVSGRHGVGYPARCAMELTYVRHWSLIGDLVIIGRTLGAIVSPGEQTS
jgi:exopolysaccharide production protein ExoY